MGKTYNSVTELQDWIEDQKLFFVSTAPLAKEGLINCSPKGADTFRILGPHQVAYQDITGSGAETIAHLKENKRIVVMFCALHGPPKIVRLHGTGRFVSVEHEEWSQLQSRFDPKPGVRGAIVIEVQRVSDSCGYGVPVYEFREERTMMEKWAQKKGPDGVKKYQAQNNRVSIDGLPAMSPDE
ncbi:MAG: pyridoxamine 5'-phosphate oxidase family protein [Planctomycetota bacterium]